MTRFGAMGSRIPSATPLELSSRPRQSGDFRTVKRTSVASRRWRPGDWILIVPCRNIESRCASKTSSKRCLPALRAPVSHLFCDRTGILWHHSRGSSDARGEIRVDLDTLFCLGSVTKPVTAQAILLLRDEGRLALDEPLERSLPEAAALRYPTLDSPRITLRHVLTHTSGLPRGARDLRGDLGREPSESELLAHLSAVTLEQAPAMHDVYSNLGYALLGLVVHRTSGEPYDEFVRDRTLTPLSMVTATFHPESLGTRFATPHRERDGKLIPAEHGPDRAYVSVGGLCASARELARFVTFQLNAWPPRDEPDPGPLCRASVRESHRVGGLQRVGRRATGLGWAIMKDSPLGEVVWHNGALPRGFKTYVAFEPSVGAGIAGLANSCVDFDRQLLGLLTTFAICHGLVRDERR